jgi:hypothetical protein
MSFSPNINPVFKPRTMREEGCAPSKYGGKDNCIYALSKPAGKRPLGRPRHRWDDNIKIDLQEM